MHINNVSLIKSRHKKNAKKNVKSFQVGLRSIYNTQHSSSFINIKGLDVESRLDTFR